MNILLAISITTGILSGLWGWVAVSFGLITWAGFLGCTSYFASPVDGLKGLTISIICNMTGVAWAMVIIFGSTWFGSDIASYIITGIVSFAMCIQAKKAWLNYIPATFIGSCATFASGGDYALVIPSLIIGGIFAFAMKTSGTWLYNKSSSTSTTIKINSQSQA